MATGGYVSGMRQGESIENFIDREVRPNTTFLEELGKVTDVVVQTLLREVDQWSIKEIIKSGSLGKGTGVKDKSDVDLIMVLNGFDLQRLRDEFPLIRKRLKEIVLSKIKFSTHDVVCEWSGETDFSIQFRLRFPRYGNEWHDVDVLPTIDSSRHGESDVYKEMEVKDKYERLYYSASFAKLQIEFVKKRDPKLKDVIRFMKYWKKTNENSSVPALPLSNLLLPDFFVYVKPCLRNKESAQMWNKDVDGAANFYLAYYPNQKAYRVIGQKMYKAFPDIKREGELPWIDIVSYGIELIVIKMWEEQTSPDRLTLRELIADVARILSNFGDLSLSWNVNYNLHHYEKKVSMPRPYIRDPANPFMDVIHRTRKIDDIERKARQLLRELQ